MAHIAEVAPDVFRLSIYHQQAGLGFNHFLVRDDEPMLVHAGLRGMHPDLKEAVAKLIDPAKLRWVNGSHFEADEWGALNHWLELAPHAEPVCGFVAAMVSIADFSNRAPRILQDGETLETGRHRFRYCATAHLPHGWDAGVLFEETNRTLFCSDLLHQDGDLAPTTEEDVCERCRQTLTAYQRGPLANYMPYTARTQQVLDGLAALEPKTLAAMHGSSYRGDGAAALRGYADVLRECLA